MRQLPLFALTVLVGLVLLYSFIAPFQGVLDRPASTGDAPTVTTEDFELPDEMKEDGQSDNGASDATTEAPASPRQNSARQVEPDLLSPSARDATPLERVAPRKPLGNLGEATALAPPPPPIPVDNTAKPTLLYRPVATAAGEIEVSGYRIALDGIDTTKPEQTCTNEGTTWPCGMAARTAFRNWLRLRAVECTVPGQPTETVLATQCKLGGVDLAQWLVDNGWARARDGSPMVESMKKAEEAKIGMFGPPPPALPQSQELPLPSFDAGPPEEPLPPQAPLPAPDAPFPPRPQ